MEEMDPYQITIGGVKADPYRIAKAYGIDDPIIFQAIKKLLRSGRKHKTRAQDVREAITSLERWEQIEAEDSGSAVTFNDVFPSGKISEPSQAERQAIKHIKSELEKARRS